MDRSKKRESEIPIEQKAILNCGHGPPIGHPIGPPTGPPIGPPQPDFLISRRLETNCDTQRGNGEVVSHQSGASAGLEIPDSSRQLMLMSPSGIIGPCYVIPSSYANHLGENLAKSGQQNPNKSNDQIWGLNHFQKNVQGHSSPIDGLIKQNHVVIKELALMSKELDDVRKELASKSAEYEDLKSKYRQLTERLNDVPYTSGENYNDDRLIDLAATDEMTVGGEMRLEDDEDLMMKSVQCSEHECDAEVKSAFDIGQVLPVTERGRVSSGSNTSFEVVGQESCEDRHRELKRMDDKFNMDVKQSTGDLRDELHSLKSLFEAFEQRLERVEALKSRLEQFEALKPSLEQHFDALKLKVDELSANAHQGARPKTNAGYAEFLLPGVGSKDCSPEREDLKQTISELRAANWKLAEQAKVLEREKEELRSCATAGDIQKLEDELQTAHQCRMEAEARVRELELERKNADQFVIQHGTDMTVMQLTTENALLKQENDLLKTQLDTYKEDFEVERRDREKINSERETLQRFYDILRNDLDNARRQLRKYEDDITSLRIDNDSMRKKLREATEQLAIKDLKAQPQKIITPTSSAALPDPSGEWKCQACTFKNPGRRSSCEICGTAKDSKSLLTPRGPSASDFAGEELEPDRCRNEVHATPLLSNLRNYGDIETD